MLPTSSIPFTAPIEESLETLTNLSDEPSLREKVDDGSGQVNAQRVIERCVRQMVGCLTAAQSEVAGPKARHISIAHESCRLLGIVLDTIAKRPQFEHSLAARSGLNFLGGQASIISKSMRLTKDLNRMVPLVALLVSEFELKGIDIPKACYDKAKATAEKKPGTQTSPVPVLAMAS